ncbi:MAG TPA: isoprenylcysteine carboxylmethyltransferase family protein [Candidatus Acidoferrales bacterium]|nr:isoprenylcysteine carboxylmethyltransferase family protein [Candidatus Acidoferrales bacterium]
MPVNIKQQVGQFVGYFVAFGLALFLPAGTLAWLAGWIFLGLFFGFLFAINFWLFRHNPGLLQERMRLGTSDQQGWDKVLFPVLLVFFFVWLIFMSLDAVRFHWSPVPVWLQLVGATVLLCSFYLLFLTFRENSYLSTVVRIQEDRGQTVVSTGPYHNIRHPMYSAILVFAVGSSLLLGSWYGVLSGLILLILLARRAMLEERALRAELPGYAAYMEDVKYRLIPYVW